MSDVKKNALAGLVQQAAAARGSGDAPSPVVARPLPPLRDEQEGAAPDQPVRRRRRPRFEEMYRRATFFFTDEQLARLEEATEITGIGKSEFVRSALDAALNDTLGRT